MGNGQKKEVPVIFDLDGTLIDSSRDIVHAVNFVLETLTGSQADSSEIVPMIGKPLDEIFATLLPEEKRCFIEEASPLFRRTYSETRFVNTFVLPGVEDCLCSLNGHPLAVATTKNTVQARKVLETVGLSRYFKHIQGSEDIPKKPDPAVVRKALAAMGLEGAKGWMVGDTAMDVLAGRSASLYTCAVTYGIGTLEELSSAGADLLLDSLEFFSRKTGLAKE